MKGIDFGYGKIKGSIIKQAGYDFVCRYLSHSPGKNITEQEIEDFKKNTLKLVLVWETTTQRPLDGKSAGISDAYFSEGMLKTLDIPGAVIYFACDNDYTPDQVLIAEDYIRGINSVIGLNRTGVYGGYNTVKHMFDVNCVKYGWQTLAWSHGKWDERAQIRQISITGPKLGGVECDTNTSTVDNIGFI